MEIVVPDEYKHLYAANPDCPIVKIPAEVLRRPANPIKKVTNHHRMLGDNMLRIMRRWNGVGLAAPQVGISERVVVIAPTEMRPIVLFNPVITKKEGEELGEEGCLSLPGLYGDVLRATYVEIEALDRRGNEVVYEMEDMAARVAQHEIAHLDGQLFVDVADPASLHWALPDHTPPAV